MDAALWQVARRRCEYCQMPEGTVPEPFEIDHIIALKHRGPTQAENLALACFQCNNHKGPNVAGVDPVTMAVVRLFHPRRDRWKRHFEWDGPLLVGRTAIGRTTIEVLEINLPHRVEIRRALMEEGEFPGE